MNDDDDDIEREHTRNIIGEAIRNTQEIRVRVVRLFDETDTSVWDGSMALLVLTAAHFKKNNITREEFLELCDIVYESSEVNHGDGDKVTTPRIN
jgi:hypothetical protein